MGDDKFDGLYMTVAQQAGGIDPLFDSFFGFLRRKTDFFTGAGDGSKAEATMTAAFAKHGKLFAAENAEKEAREAKRRADEEARKKRVAEEKAKQAAASAPPQRFEDVADEAVKSEPSAAPAAAADDGAPAADEESKGASTQLARATPRAHVLAASTCPGCRHRATARLRLATPARGGPRLPSQPARGAPPLSARPGRRADPQRRDHGQVPVDADAERCHGLCARARGHARQAARRLHRAAVVACWLQGAAAHR